MLVFYVRLHYVVVRHPAEFSSAAFLAYSCEFVSLLACRSVASIPSLNVHRRIISTFILTIHTVFDTVNELFQLHPYLCLYRRLPRLSPCRSCSWRGNCVQKRGHHIILYSASSGYTELLFFSTIFFGLNDCVSRNDVLARLVDTRRFLCFGFEENKRKETKRNGKNRKE